jgi:hypothetical protein
MAGLFDGEGHVGVNLDHRGRLSARLHICNTDRRVVELFAERYGGKIYSRPPTIGSRTIYEWYATGVRSNIAASELVEHCMVKKAQLAAYIALKAVIPSRGRTLTACESTARAGALAAFEQVATRYRLSQLN